MGVKNLWRLLLPAGHRLSIETLSHQTLAIDASIWFAQISNACRDPETGRLLPNRPHVRIFLTRLMRLLYHRIRPVVVFDGVMPEVKRREIRRRKDRREKLWRDDDDDDGGEGGGALKRTAKKILVKRLREWREKEAREAKRRAGDGGGGGGAGPAAEGAKGKDRASGFTNGKGKHFNGGALAAGFTLGDDEDDDAAGEGQPSKSNEIETSAEEHGDPNDNPEEIISIHSEDSKMEQVTQQQFQTQLERYRQKHDDNDNNGDEGQFESENDWEMSRAVQSSIHESMRQTNRRTPQQQRSSSEKNASFDHSHYRSATNRTIAALPALARSKWIDSQKASRRIASRRECIEAAANPEEYSSAQLRNFLEGSRLNERAREIGKLAELRAEIGTGEGSEEEEKDDGGGGRGRASMRVLFGEDDSDAEGNEGGGGFLASSPADARAADSSRKGSEENEVASLEGDDDGDAHDNGSVTRTNRNESMNSNENGNVPSSSKSAKEAEGTFAPSVTLLELSTADQEWEDWAGVAGAAEAHVSEGARPTGAHRPRADDDAGATKLDASEGDSDSDDDDDDMQGESFLMMGHRALSSRVVESKPAPDMKDAGVEKGVALLGANAAPDNDAPSVEDEDDVDWEDGDSGGDGIAKDEAEDGVDWEDGDSGGDHIADDMEDGAKTGARESGLCNRKDSGDAMRNPSSRSPESLEANAPESMLSEDEAHSLKHPEQFAKETNHGLNEKDGDITEIPSGDDVIFERGDDDAEQNDTPASNPAPDNIKGEALAIDSSDESNEFDVLSPNNQTTVALQHAQETASRLTSWAGRAFQRAISEHVGQQKHHDSTGKGANNPEKTPIDLTCGNDAIGIDVDDAERGGNPADQIEATGRDDENDASPEPPNSEPRKQDLFDTSLEGLNDAHDAILEREKAIERGDMSITDEMKGDILSLLRLCGIPWVESPSEAEAQCAALEELGLVDGVVTEDSDVFVFGGRKVYKNFFQEQKYVESYYAKDIERDLGLKKQQLVALAMLLGGDYTDGVRGVGIVNGMEALRAFPIESDSEDGIADGLTRFREWLDGFDDPASDRDSGRYISREALFRKKHQTARGRWAAPSDFPSRAIINAYLKPVVDKSEARFSWGKPDPNGLRQFCAETLGWEREETDRVVDPVLKAMESGSKQTRIESYFMRYEDGITFAKVKSKRLQAVLEDIQVDSDAEEEDTVAADGVELASDDGEVVAGRKSKR